MTLFSSTVSAWQQWLASQYNNVRKDVLLRAWDYATSTGSANAYLLSIDAQFTAYATGDTFVFKANFTNTASCTININSVGVKTLKDTDWEPLWNGAIQSWAIIECAYNGTDLIVKSGLNYMNYYYFGNGGDGDVTISSNTTLTRDMYYNNLVINTSINLDTAWYAVFIRWTLSWAWKIVRNGNNGTIGTDGTAGTWGNGWAWGAALATWTCGVNYGWWGGWTWSSWGTAWNGTNGSDANPSYATTSTVWAVWWDGGTGFGVVWTGWLAGTATQGIYANTILSIGQIMSITMYPGRWYYTQAPLVGMPGSWGGGGWDGTWGTSGGGGGGWAWGNGGSIFLAVRTFAGTWTIESKWGNGGNGWAANPTGEDAGWWGGWGWGNGWVVTIIYRNGTPWSRTLTGWTWGTWWAWRLTGTAWGNGNAGTTWQSILLTV